MSPREAGHAVADRAANPVPDARERRERIGFRIDGVKLEAASQFFEDEGLLNADQRQFDIREGSRFVRCAVVRVDAVPTFSFDLGLPDGICGFARYAEAFLS
jgi:hypothetical protein